MNIRFYNPGLEKLVPALSSISPFGNNLSPMAHENMTYGTKWPLHIQDGANL